MRIMFIVICFMLVCGSSYANMKQQVGEAVIYTDDSGNRVVEWKY